MFESLPILKLKSSKLTLKKKTFYAIENLMIHLLMELEFWKYVTNFFAIKEDWIVHINAFVIYDSGLRFFLADK
jgi:hypothetical protein